jgi:hypothetical protein
MEAELYHISDRLDNHYYRRQPITTIRNHTLGKFLVAKVKRKKKKEKVRNGEWKISGGWS